MTDQIDRGDWINLIPPLRIERPTEKILPNVDLILMDWGAFERRIKVRPEGAAKASARLCKFAHEVGMRHPAAHSIIFLVQDVETHWSCKMTAGLYKGRSRVVLLEEVSGLQGLKPSGVIYDDQPVSDTRN